MAQCSVAVVVLLGLCSYVAANFMRTLHVTYEDGVEASHFELGRSIGIALGDAIRAAWEVDDELKGMEAWVANNSTGQRIFAGFVSESSAAFPAYTREIEGMAAGSGIPLQRFMVNQLREELAQWVPEMVPRRGKCTTVYAYNPAGGVYAMAHNDDWGQNWRSLAYFVVATALDERGDVKFRFGTWLYPGYLLGSDINYNSHGLAFTVNSLFPLQFLEEGVGVAWVSRHMLDAQSVEEAIRRASNPRVSTAISYNLANIRNGSMFNVEVDSGGRAVKHNITGLDYHVNSFKNSRTPEWLDPSSPARAKRWAQMQPASVPAIRAFMSDTADAQYPVYRNHIPPDDCFTEVTGIFDFVKGTLSLWNSPPASSSPVAVFDITDGKHSAQFHTSSTPEPLGTVV